MDGVLALPGVRRRRGRGLARRDARLRMAPAAGPAPHAHPRQCDRPRSVRDGRRRARRPVPRLPHGEGQGRRAGQTLADDLARVAAVREVMGPEGRIRVDANGLWNVDEAEHAIHALAEFDLEYVEQPCATVAELAEVRTRVRRLGIPIAADESVRKAADPLLVALAGAADVLVVKAQPLRGARRALGIVRDAGLPAVVSSAIDTSIGIAMGAALAAALPTLDYDCGLGTASLLAEDVTDDPLVPRDGAIPVGRVVPDPAALTRTAASPERREWWLARLARVHERLERQSEL